METNEAGSAFDDIKRARLAAQRVAVPWWLSLYGAVGGAVLLAFFGIGPIGEGGRYSLIMVVAAAAFVCSIIALRRRRATPSVRGAVGPYGTATIATTVTACFVVPGIGQEFGGDPTVGKWAVLFGVAIAILGGGQLLGIYLQQRQNV